MAYKFANNVYLISGKMNACIYDLNNGKLYSINSNLKHALIELVENDHLTSEGLHPVIQQLLQAKILEESNVVEPLKTLKDVGRANSAIDFAWIEVTNQCNLRCVHCYAECNAQTGKALTLSEYDKVISELARLGVKGIQLTGGEPLLLKDQLVQMIRHGKQYFEKIQVYTNATLIDDGWIEIFKKYDVTVALSLHSYNEEDHEKVTTVKGSYDKTINAINLLQKNNVSHIIQGVAMRDVAVGVQAETIAIQKRDNIRMAGKANWALMDKAIFMDKVITKETFTQAIDAEEVRNAAQRHKCFGRRLYIDSNMDVFPCVMERRLSHGNLKDNQLQEILNPELLFLTKDLIEGCKDCEFRYACVDCRSDSLSDNPFAKPWYCTYDPENGVWLSGEMLWESLIERIFCQVI